MITAFGLRFISPWHAVFQTIGIAFCLLYPLNASAAPLKVFWCNDGEFGRLDGAQFAKLKSADIDGSNVSTIRTSSYTYMRGCHYDSIVDKLFLVENDYDIYRVAPDNSSSLLLQTFISGSPLPHIIGSIVLDARDLKMYWPENKNWQILRASSSDPLVTTSYPYKNEPEAISLSPGTEIRTPFDIEIDWLNHNLYFANYGGSSGGSIGKVSLDDFTSETIVVTPREAVGIAVDPIHRQIFYTLDNNDIWTASLDGGNQTNLTPIIGPAFKSAHRRMDIDYDIETDKIYWIENSNPFNVGLDGLAPGKLRRANPDGTNVEDVVSDVGYYATFLSLKYGTLSAELDNPVSGRTYVTDMRLSYSLAEPPNPGTISVKFKQGATTKASLTMKDSRSITTTLTPLSPNADPGAFASATSGFPLAEGSYTVELSYQDIPGNPAFTTSASDVVLAHPTATPTTTPTLTSTPTSTPTATVTPTVTPTATVGINQVPTATPTPLLQCISSLKKAKVRVKDRIATVSLSGKKGGRYRVLARFLGKSNSKPKVVSITAAKNGALHAAFGPLKKGSWEFSYSITLNKLKSMSCSTQKNIR